MTGRATAQPSGEAGADELRRELERVDQARIDGVGLPFVSKGYRGIAVDALARLDAAERERDALRQQVVMLGDARAVAGQQRAILDEFGVVHARHDHFLLAQEVMRLRYAATNPDTGGDHA